MACTEGEIILGGWGQYFVLMVKSYQDEGTILCTESEVIPGGRGQSHINKFHNIYQAWPTCGPREKYWRHSVT